MNKLATGETDEDRLDTRRESSTRPPVYRVVQMGLRDPDEHGRDLEERVNDLIDEQREIFDALDE